MAGIRPAESHLAAVLVDHELDAGGVAALANVYQKTFVELAPLVGARGVRGIFARAFELTQSEHACLRAFVIGDEPAAAASALGPCLARAPRDDARLAAVAVYTVFFGLIVRFVGFELTVQVLRAAWPNVDLKEIR